MNLQAVARHFNFYQSGEISPNLVTLAHESGNLIIWYFTNFEFLKFGLHHLLQITKKVSEAQDKIAKIVANIFRSTLSNLG